MPSPPESSETLALHYHPTNAHLDRSCNCVCCTNVLERSIVLHHRISYSFPYLHTFTTVAFRFFPSVYYLSTSKVAIAVLGNFAFAVALCTYFLLTKVPSHSCLYMTKHMLGSFQSFPASFAEYLLTCEYAQVIFCSPTNVI